MTRGQLVIHRVIHFVWRMWLVWWSRGDVLWTVLWNQKYFLKTLARGVRDRIELSLPAPLAELGIGLEAELFTASLLAAGAR